MICNKHKFLTIYNNKHLCGLQISWSSGNWLIQVGLGWAVRLLLGPVKPGNIFFHGDRRGTREQAQLHRHFLSIWSRFACKHLVSQNITWLSPKSKGEIHFASLVEGTSESHDKGHDSGRSKESGPHLPKISRSTFVLKNYLLFV